MNIHKYIIFTIAIFNAQITFSQNYLPLENASGFIKKLKETSLTTQTIKADFTEYKFVSYLKEPAKSVGIFYYKKDNKMRWEKTKPTSYIFLVSGNKVLLKENDKQKDVSSFNVMIGKIKDLMITLINGDISDNNTFTPSYFQNKDFYMVKLIPKNRKLALIFDHIQLVFSKETMRLNEMTLFEKSGDKSVMKFFNDRVNENLNDKLFTEF